MRVCHDMIKILASEWIMKKTHLLSTDGMPKAAQLILSLKKQTFFII